MMGVPYGPGSRPTDGAQEVSTLAGFDPSRIAELVRKAAPLLECGHHANRPNPRVKGERIVGFVIGEDDIGLGLSEPLFALEAVTELARLAIATEARRAETSLGSVHEGAGPQDIAQ